MNLSELSDAQLDALITQKTDPNVAAIHSIETGGASATANPVNPASGARSSMQTMPATAGDPGYGIKPSNKTPVDDTRLGVEYYGKMLDTYKDPTVAAVAYNWGPGRTDKWLKKGGNIQDLPDETLDYVIKFRNKTAGAPAPKPADAPVAATLSPGEQEVGGGEAPAQQQQPVQSITGGAWHAPEPGIAGNLMMGAGDFLRRGTRGILKGGAYIAGKVAPDSQFTKDINQAVGQVDQTISGQDAQYAQEAKAAGVDPDNFARTLGQAAPAFLIPAGRMASLPGALAGGAASGAIAGAAMTKPGEDYGENALGGAAGGAAGGGLAYGLGKVIRGVTVRPEVQQMRDMGVTPLPGQTLGGRAQVLEEKATSIPILGDGITMGKTANIKDLNRGVYQDALNEIGVKLPDDIQAGSDGVRFVRKQIGDVYNDLQSTAQFAPRGQFIRDMQDIRTTLAQTAPSKLGQFDEIVSNQLARKLRGGVMDGQQWADSRSFISKTARDQRLGNPDPDRIGFSEALTDLNNAINDQVAINSPAGLRPRLQAANRAYARYAQIEGAAGSPAASNQGNVFGPAQYTAAIRKGSTKAQKSTNSGMNAQTGNAAQDVLGQHYPNSGTAGRAALGAVGLGAGYLINPAVLGGAIGLGGMYATKAGRAAMFAALARRPDLARQLGGALSGAAGNVGGAVGSQTGN